MILFLISFSIFAIYLFSVLKYIGDVPQSLSETYYLLGNRYYHLFDDPSEMGFNHLRASIFTLMMWLVSFTLLPAMLDLTPYNLQFLAFLALTGICFVGAAPQFKLEFEGKIHVTAAYSAAFFGLLWALTVCKQTALISLGVSIFAVLVAALMTNTFKSSRTFWLEMVAFGTVYISTLFMLL